jgi:hypothetical protein
MVYFKRRIMAAPSANSPQISTDNAASCTHSPVEDSDIEDDIPVGVIADAAVGSSSPLRVRADTNAGRGTAEDTGDGPTAETMDGAADEEQQSMFQVCYRAAAVLQKGKGGMPATATTSGKALATHPCTCAFLLSSLQALREPLPERAEGEDYLDEFLREGEELDIVSRFYGEFGSGIFAFIEGKADMKAYLKTLSIDGPAGDCYCYFAEVPSRRALRPVHDEASVLKLIETAENYSELHVTFGRKPDGRQFKLPEVAAERHPVDENLPEEIGGKQMQHNNRQEALDQADEEKAKNAVRMVIERQFGATLNGVQMLEIWEMLIGKSENDVDGLVDYFLENVDTTKDSVLTLPDGSRFLDNKADVAVLMGQFRDTSTRSSPIDWPDEFPDADLNMGSKRRRHDRSNPRSGDGGSGSAVETLALALLMKEKRLSKKDKKKKRKRRKKEKEKRRKKQRKKERREQREQERYQQDAESSEQQEQEEQYEVAANMYQQRRDERAGPATAVTAPAANSSDRAGSEQQ